MSISMYILLGLVCWLSDVAYDYDFHVKTANDKPVVYLLAMLTGFVLFWPFGLAFMIWQTAVAIYDLYS